MAIWCLFTQCESEPTFWGYVTSKKEAIEWMKEEMKEREIDCEITEYDGHLEGYDCDEPESKYSVEAVRLERI